MTPELTEDHILNVCRIGQDAACCRYLTIDPNGWACERQTELAAVIDQRVAAGLFTARSVNCAGFPPPGANDA